LRRNRDLAPAAPDLLSLRPRQAAALSVSLAARPARPLGLCRPRVLAEQAAASIGWANTPFQYEVGVANLGLGLTSIYAAFRSFEARVAVAIVASCFLMGAGVIHIMDIAGQGNLAPGNAGPILFTDFLTPIAVLALLVFASDRWKPKSPATLALEAELAAAKKAMRDYRQALSNLGKD
jgi:hypothetical protein